MKLWHVLCLAAVALLATMARADVAISIRYFKIEGTSHYHLYLYSDDGKLIRQLTAPEDAQDTRPMFSKGGEEIIFTRETKWRKEIYAIRTDGTNLHAMEKAPEGYPLVISNGEIYTMEGGGENDTLWTPRGEDLFMKTPDGKQEVIVKSADNFKKKDPAFEAMGFAALTIRDLADEKEVRVATAGDAPDNYCDLSTYKKSPFLTLTSLRLAFFWQWQGSTAGPRLGAVDLDQKKSVFLSANPAFAVRHGTRDGFFCVTNDYYQPLGQTGHTVNCLYLDWWNGKLERTRFASAISLFGGASVRIKDQPQLNIPAHEDE